MFHKPHSPSFALSFGGQARVSQQNPQCFRQKRLKFFYKLRRIYHFYPNRILVEIGVYYTQEAVFSPYIMLINGIKCFHAY